MENDLNFHGIRNDDDDDDIFLIFSFLPMTLLYLIAFNSIALFFFILFCIAVKFFTR